MGRIYPANNIPYWYTWKGKDCQKMACACGLKKKTGLKREHCENDKGCGKFIRADYGCWSVGNGAIPVRICKEGCNCICHDGDAQ